MSQGRRAFNILRGYIDREWDRLQGLEWFNAQAELDAPTIPTTTNAGVETPAPVELSPEDELKLARQILGVSETATFAEISKAYERLAKRSDPKRFPEGSEVQAQAEQIHRRVSIAYNKLAATFPATEKRFQGLEIE